MKANELMIGDWVAIVEPDNYHGYNAKVRIVNDETGYIMVFIEYAHLHDVLCDDLQPIPLTPEILEENGLFEHDTNRSPLCVIAEAYNVVFNDKDGKPYSWLNIQDISSLESKRWHISIWGKCNFSISGYIGYVHELQHALRLCGIDKEIEL